MPPLEILAITPGTGFQAPAWERVLGSGINALMLREPMLEATTMLEAARWCRRNFPATRIWVNGRLDVALAADCGLHAPEAYPVVPTGLVPLSRPLHEEGQYSARQEAEQLLLGPVFPVPGKGSPWGALRCHAFLKGLPEEGPRIFALGGIAPARMKELYHPRLTGVALIRALWEAPEPRLLIQQLRAAWAGSNAVT